VKQNEKRVKKWVLSTIQILFLFFYIFLNYGILNSKRDGIKLFGF
jgi:hypothetical protein